MAAEEHLQIFRQGVEAWNEWRQNNPESIPDLHEANLSGANLSRAYLWNVVLREANLSGADMTEASLLQANLNGANLFRADLCKSLLVETDLCGSTLTESKVYGVSVWAIRVSEGTKQENLIITDSERGEPAITVDNIKVAQFIYMLLNT
jgi:hypothetical protein